MVGRSAYHQPALLLGWDQMIQTNAQEFGYFLGEQVWMRVQEGIIEQTIAWMHECREKDMPFHLAAITRHILGFAHGLGGSRFWRQQLSDYRLMGTVKTESEIRHFYETAAKRLRIFSETYENSSED
jgi:tRNA-dihydrouridine synthase A